jgi:prophage regulatory protein
VEAANDNLPVLMSPKEAARETSLSRQLLTLMSREGQFPLPVQLGERRQAYVRAEVIGWVQSRIAARARAAA